MDGVAVDCCGGCSGGAVDEGVDKENLGRVVDASGLSGNGDISTEDSSQMFVVEGLSISIDNEPKREEASTSSPAKYKCQG